MVSSKQRFAICHNLYLCLKICKGDSRCVHHCSQMLKALDETGAACSLQLTVSNCRRSPTNICVHVSLQHYGKQSEAPVTVNISNCCFLIFSVNDVVLACVVYLLHPVAQPATGTGLQQLAVHPAPVCSPCRALQQDSGVDFPCCNPHTACTEQFAVVSLEPIDALTYAAWHDCFC